jgi:hypothetical protein
VQLSAQTRERIAEIQATHVPIRMKVPGFWFKRLGCKACGVLWKCYQRTWADDVEAGRRAGAGWRP